MNVVVESPKLMIIQEKGGKIKEDWGCQEESAESKYLMIIEMKICEFEIDGWIMIGEDNDKFGCLCLGVFFLFVYANVC